MLACTSNPDYEIRAPNEDHSQNFQKLIRLKESIENFGQNSFILYIFKVTSYASIHKFVFKQICENLNNINLVYFALILGPHNIHTDPQGPAW